MKTDAYKAFSSEYGFEIIYMRAIALHVQLLSVHRT